MTNAFNHVLKEMDQRKESLAQALISGAAKDYAEYKNMCGEIRGLSLAHSLTTDLLRKLEKDEDE